MKKKQQQIMKIKSVFQKKESTNKYFFSNKLKKKTLFCLFCLTLHFCRIVIASLLPCNSNTHSHRHAHPKFLTVRFQKRFLTLLVVNMNESVAAISSQKLLKYS